jgi:hypothetical protein
MTRSWIQYPTDIPLETSVGTVYLNITNGHHIYIDASSNTYPDKFANSGHLISRHLVYRDTDYLFSGHAYRTHYTWDFVQPYGEPALTNVSRRNTMFSSDAAPKTHRAAILTAILDALNEWQLRLDTAALLVEAELADANNKILRLDEQIARDAAALAELKKQKRRLEKREAKAATVV